MAEQQSGLRPGVRVKIHPASALFMRGVMHADVERLEGQTHVRVKDNYGNSHVVRRENVEVIDA